MRLRQYATQREMRRAKAWWQRERIAHDAAVVAIERLYWRDRALRAETETARVSAVLADVLSKELDAPWAGPVTVRGGKGATDDQQ